VKNFIGIQKTLNHSLLNIHVIPAKAGIHFFFLLIFLLDEKKKQSLSQNGFPLSRE